jgi:hypothetical protein
LLPRQTGTRPRRCNDSKSIGVYAWMAAFCRSRHSHSSGKPSVPAAANAGRADFRAGACGSRRAAPARPRIGPDRPRPVPRPRSIPHAARGRAVSHSARLANCAASSATAVLRARSATARARRVRCKRDWSACRRSLLRSNVSNLAGFCSPSAADAGTPRASSADRDQPTQRCDVRCRPHPRRSRSEPLRRPDRGRCSDIQTARPSTR